MADIFLETQEELFLVNNPYFIVCFAVIVVLLLLLMFYYMRQEKIKLHEASVREVNFYKKKLSLLTEFSGGLVFTFDPEQDTAVLEGETNLLNQSKQEMKDCFSVIRENSSRFAVNPDDIFQILEQISSGKEEICESILIKGEIYQKELPVWVHIRAKRIFSEADKKRLLFGYICREQEMLEVQDSKSQKMCDSETGFYNQYGMRNELSRLFSEAASGVRYAFILIKLAEYERYKTDFPEDLLQRVVKRVRNCMKGMFREEDVLGRISDDEFVVCMSHVTSREDVIQKIQLLKEQLNEVQRQAEGGLIQLEEKITIYPMDGENYESLLYAARN